MRTSKMIISVFIVLAFATISRAQVAGIANPASQYARFMGIKTEIKIDGQGNQFRVCIFPDSIECDEWDFFRGKCGQEYSYCVQKGCVTMTDSTDTSEFAVCGCLDSLRRQVKIPLVAFMEQHGDTLQKNTRKTLRQRR